MARLQDEVWQWEHSAGCRPPPKASFSCPSTPLEILRTNSPSTWIYLHPNKLVVMLQKPAYTPPLPGSLPGPHSPPLYHLLMLLPASFLQAYTTHPALPPPHPAPAWGLRRFISSTGRGCPECLWSRQGRA